MCQGERVTWEKLSAIQANCGIEMKLDACMVRMGEKIMEAKQAERNGLARRNGLRTRSLQKMSRIPSWLNLSALGVHACLTFADSCMSQVLLVFLRR